MDGGEWLACSLTINGDHDEFPIRNTGAAGYQLQAFVPIVLR
jgi:hypothetical protein